MSSTNLKKGTLHGLTKLKGEHDSFRHSQRIECPTLSSGYWALIVNQLAIPQEFIVIITIHLQTCRRGQR